MLSCSCELARRAWEPAWLPRLPHVSQQRGRLPVPLRRHTVEVLLKSWESGVCGALGGEANRSLRDEGLTDSLLEVLDRKSVV